MESPLEICHTGSIGFSSELAIAVGIRAFFIDGLVQNSIIVYYLQFFIGSRYQIEEV
ncbi:hypothetical protein IQ238_24890 [Pleurocapsales cyanobacterium LEGE 06147]|nr:hypothetical protein [Pleurocapsales cyanobacterium LEGE 06147]